MRKDAGLEVTDRIAVTIDTTDAIQVACKQFEAYICNEVLATELIFHELKEGQKEDIESEGDTMIQLIKTN
jgi:isoleucyl-tRNA synthetase